MLVPTPPVTGHRLHCRQIILFAVIQGTWISELVPLGLSIGDDDIRPHLDLAADVLLDGCRVVVSTRTNDIRVIDLSTLAVVITGHTELVTTGAGELVRFVRDVAIEMLVPEPSLNIMVLTLGTKSPSGPTDLQTASMICR